MSVQNQENRQSRGPFRGPGGSGGGGPMGMAMGGGQKAKNFNKTIAALWRYLQPYQATIIFVLLLALLSTVFSIVGPKLLGKVTTKLVEGLLAYMAGSELLTDFAYMGRIISLLIALYVVSSLCSYAQSFIMSQVSMKVTYNLRKNTSEKMHRLPLRYYDTRTRGEILSRITNDVDLVSQTLNQSLTQLLTSLTTILGVLCMMLSISWLMTLAALLIIPATMGLLGILLKRSQGFFREQQKSLGEINGHIEEIYGGHVVVQAYNGQQAARERFEEINSRLLSSAWRSQFISSLMQPVMTMIGNFGYVMVSILGGYLAVKRAVDIGDIQAFIQYMRSFTQPMGQLATISNTLQSTVAAAERVFEFLEEEEEAADNDEHVDFDVKGNVEFSHVRFGYRPEQIIIQDFSAQVKAGQKVAIVGPTGAGKTTIVKLLMRFYELNSGSITIDGVNIAHMSRQQLRSCFGMVLQDTWLYNATIMENIRYGSFEATDQQVIAAAKAAHCDEFIRSLPGGYQMVLNEEASNISQGQKQLFTIARVILANPKILILDEATSSVDTRTEILIQNAMDAMIKNRTSFVIAHRLSTVKNADVILVLKDGDIAEQGSHEELLERGGFYADLYNSQFEQEEEEPAYEQQY